MQHFLIKFQVQGLNGSPVTGAKLKLYNTNDSTVGGQFYQVTNQTWTEESVTWNNAPAAESTLIALLGAVEPGNWYEVDVSSLITGDGTYSLRVSSTSGNGADYSSKEGAHPPVLEVTTGSGATITPNPTATFTITPTPTATSATPNGNAEYFYDGDGNLVKSIIGSVTTYYPNTSYEKRVDGANETVMKYYFAGSIRIAMRENGAITWLLSDHLGSTSVTADGAGSLLTSLKYTAYGEIRTGNSLTDYQYTGQRNEAEIGLYYYVARFYDPQLARFISADTLVPEPGSSKAYDRFAYVNGNPINYNDPSGHMAWLGDGGGDSNTNILAGIITTNLANMYNWKLLGNWNLSEIKEVRQAARDIENKIVSMGGNGQEWVQTYLGGVTFAKEKVTKYPIISLRNGDYTYVASSINDLLGGAPAFVLPSNRITFKNTGINRETIVHELGHTLDNWGGPSKVFEAAIFGGGWSDALIEFLGGTPYGFRCADKTPSELANFLPLVIMAWIIRRTS